VSDTEPPRDVDERYQASLLRHAVTDVQPLYRQLLRRLKMRDAEEYNEAVGRYESDVAAGGQDVDPLRSWVEYGAWLAQLLAPGRLVSIDRDGRAVEPGGTPPLGPLLLHLPEENGERAMPIAVPAEPSAAQEAARQLLCAAPGGGRSG
jgi:hypothetical protein